MGEWRRRGGRGVGRRGIEEGMEVEEAIEKVEGG